MTNKREVLISMKNLKKYFPVTRDKLFTSETLQLKANDGISLDIYKGETFGLVGESGCGKSTFGRALLQIYEQTAGTTIFFGRDIYEFNPKYVPIMIDSIRTNRDLIFDLEKEAEKILEEYTSLSHDHADKQAKFNEYENTRQTFENTLYDVTSIIGGLILEDNIDPVVTLAKREYEARVELAKNPKDKALEAKVKEIEAELDKYREKNKNKENYDKYEEARGLGIDLTKLEEEEMRLLRKDLQLIFQDPYSSLNPRLTVGQIISEGMITHGLMKPKDPDFQDRVIEIMKKCGLAPYFIHRYPHQFSGGQRQRIGIARSVALEPQFIVCDEAVSALDVSIQSQIINLLLDLKEQANLTYLFISHDLSVVKYISDRVGVMYLGNLVEIADTEDLYANPLHPYTEALLSAIPTTDRTEKKEQIVIDGDIPSPINPPQGCKFSTRCPYVTEICREIVPQFEDMGNGHLVACHHKLNEKKD